MASTRTWIVWLTLIVSMSLTGCSGSDEPPPPSQADLVTKLTHDSVLQTISALIRSDRVSGVRVCVAKGLRAHGDASDLQDYVDGKKTFAQIRGNVAPIPQDCVRDQINDR